MGSEASLPEVDADQFDVEKRWPELLEPLTPTQREQVVEACWYVLRDGFLLRREDAARIAALVVDDPERFALLYAPYTEVKDSNQAGAKTD